jgi:hypothetical protein
MLSLGPFSIRVVAVAAAALLAWLVARLIQRRPPDGQHKSASSLILDVLLLGLVAARIGYVAQWWREYAATPRSIVALGDGGFDWRIGLAAALLFAGGGSRRRCAGPSPPASSPGWPHGALRWAHSRRCSAMRRRSPQCVAGADGTPVLRNALPASRSS